MTSLARTAVLALCLQGALAAADTTPAAPQRSEAETKRWHQLVGILQYVSGDYVGAVESGDKAELAEQASFGAEALATAKALGPDAAPYVPKVEALSARISRAEDPQGVSRECAELAEALVVAGGLSRHPKSAPDLAQGAQLFATHCQSCHGATGAADTAIAKALKPPPANFQDPDLYEGLSPYKVYNTTTFGITGTAMPPFPTLSEPDRWALAFFVFTLRQPACDHTPPRLGLNVLATTDDPTLSRLHGEKELACLRRALPKADDEASLMLARNGVSEALKLGAAGDSPGAKSALLDAYLNGIEPVEPLLRSRDGKLVSELETLFLQARVAAEKGSPELQTVGPQLLAVIDRARGTKGTTDMMSVFLQALLIVVREGFEATIVIAALLAVLKKMNATNLSRVVHAGWISAFVVGGVVYFFARHLIAGANREWMEGLIALAAVGMLLYAALWLNARNTTRKFMGKLRADMQGALGRGSIAGLFFISFSALLRESLETALFLQGLSIDSPDGAMWGALGGCVALLGLVLMVNRVGYVLPMKPLFTASTFLLFATAVVLLGKGLHAIQEVGALPLAPIPFVKVELLGVFPDAVSLIPQLLLALSPIAYFWWQRRTERTAAATG